MGQCRQRRLNQLAQLRVWPRGLVGAGLLALLVLSAGPVPGRAQANGRAQEISRCVLLGGDPATRDFLRCLVDRYHWTPEAAAAVSADTIQARAILAARQDSMAAARRRRSDAAAFRAELAARAARYPWVSSDSAQQFYRRTCPTAARIKGDDLREWSDTLGLKLQGYRRSTAPGC